jgi:hypothetical protein
MGVAAFGRKPHFMFLAFAALCRGAATPAANFAEVSKQFSQREHFARRPGRWIE